MAGKPPAREVAHIRLAPEQRHAVERGVCPFCEADLTAHCAGSERCTWGICTTCHARTDGQRAYQAAGER